MPETPVRLNGWYNGFSMYERRKVIPIRRELVRRGLAKDPDTCSICGLHDPGGPGRRSTIHAHHEDYREALMIHPVCGSCHYLLHTRFRHPDRWRRRVNEYHQDGAWFSELTMDVTAMFRPFQETYPEGLPRPDDHSQPPYR
jgi:hypothetical protein